MSITDRGGPGGRQRNSPATSRQGKKVAGSPLWPPFRKQQVAEEIDNRRGGGRAAERISLWPPFGRATEVRPRPIQTLAHTEARGRSASRPGRRVSRRLRPVGDQRRAVDRAEPGDLVVAWPAGEALQPGHAVVAGGGVGENLRAAPAILRWFQLRAGLAVGSLAPARVLG